MGSVGKPALQYIDRIDVEKIIQAICDDGGVVIKNFTTVEAVDRVNKDTKPFLDADKPWKVS
jgi:predicted enzyme related to lactoylglutathione lyase